MVGGPSRLLIRDRIYSYSCALHPKPLQPPFLGGQPYQLGFVVATVARDAVAKPVHFSSPRPYSMMNEVAMLIQKERTARLPDQHGHPTRVHHRLDGAQEDDRCDNLGFGTALERGIHTL